MKIFFIFFLQQCLDVSLNWLLGFPGGSDDEESNLRPGFAPWVRKIPWRTA